MWLKDDGGYHIKSSTLWDTCPPFDVHPSFSPPVSKLIQDLHLFFRTQALQAAHVSGWLPEPESGYEDFLRIIKDTICALTEDGISTMTNDSSLLPQEGPGPIRTTCSKGNLHTDYCGTVFDPRTMESLHADVHTVHTPISHETGSNDYADDSAIPGLSKRLKTNHLPR
ncbi:hypothetical protein K439DRAFT_1633396 [Ramaria rubella]|nr:hypothetical protein K439DRAFT_1633396 [Ramaria rubella]